MLTRYSKQSKRGVVIVITLFFMMILGLMAAAMFKIIPQEHVSVRRHIADQQAHYAATSGVKDLLAWIVYVRSPNNSVANAWTPYPKDPMSNQGTSSEPYTLTTLADASAAPFRMYPYFSSAPTISNTDPLWSNAATYFYGSMPVLKRSTAIALSDGWCADVYCFPEKRTYPHDFTNQAGLGGKEAAAYTAVSLAFRDLNGDGLLTTSIGERYVLRAKANFSTDTLAKYAYFTDDWSATTAITLAKNNSRAQFDGPFHTNSYPRLLTPDGDAYWTQTGYSQSFLGQLTYAGTLTGNVANKDHDGIAWINGNVGADNASMRPYDAANNAVASRYNRMMAAGETGIRSVKRVELPTDSTPLAKAAWGDNNTLSSQTSLPDDSVYINTQSTNPGTAAGGVFIKGNVQKMTLEVLNSNGVAIGDNNTASSVPSSSNDGNPAMRITMSRQFTATVGTQANPTSSNGANSYTPTSSSTNKTTSNYTTTPMSSQSTVTYPINGSSQSTINYNTSGSSQTSSNSNCATSSQTATWGSGAGAGQQITYTVPYTVPCQKNYTVNYQTGTSNSQSTINYFLSNTSSQRTRSYTNSNWASNSVSPSTVNYSITTAGGTTSYTTTNYTTTKFNPKALVVEANTTPMTLTASTFFPNGTPSNVAASSVSFVLPNGTTNNVLSVSTNKAYNIVQDKVNPALWVVKELSMVPDVPVASAVASNYHLNGAVHVNGNLGNATNSDSATESGGLSGWNKGRKTVLAESYVWTNPSTFTSNLQQLRIDGHLRVFGTPNGSQISGTNLYKHNVGLMANTIDVKIRKADWTGTGAPFNGNANRELFVYAVLLSRGTGLLASNVPTSTYGNSNSLENSTLSAGTIRLFGGLLQKTQGTLRIGDRGWNQEYNYDPQNAIAPPPFFPILNDFVIYNYVEDRV